MIDLPQSWVMPRIDQIADINPRHPRTLNDALPVTFVRMPALSETSCKFESTDERSLGHVRKGFTHFAEGDVLFAKITPCMENGKAAVALNLRNGLGCGTTELHVMRPLGGVDPKYLFYFIHQECFREQAARNFTGTAGQLRVPTSFIKETEIPLPPLNEQRRIVLKLEKLLSRVNTAQERLATIPRILKRFRQSVLAAACSGNLTTHWREKNFNERSKQANGGNTELPESWSWRTFESASNEITVGYVGPMAKEYLATGIPFLRSMNVRPFRFEPCNLKFISSQFHHTILKSRLRPGDVAIVRSGNSGVACVIPESLPEANCSDLVILRPNKDLDSTYACVFMNSTAAQAHVNAVKVGIAQGHFNVGSMKNTLIPLPPITEQQEIVRRVGALLKTADELEARYLKAKAHVDKLTQSILAKAFRGELVPQDPNDEPASVLLERITHERNGSAAVKRRSRK